MSYKLKVEHVFYFLGVVALIAVIGLFIYPKVKAAGAATLTSGPSNVADTWVAGSMPTASSAVTINSGHTITIPVDITTEGASLTSGGNITLDAATSNLTITGTTTINQPAAAGATNTIDVADGTFTTGSLSLNSSAASGSKLLINNGTANITSTLGSGGVIDTGGTTAKKEITITGTGALKVASTFSAAITFTAGQGTVQLTGSSSQVLPGQHTYYNLDIINTSTAAGQVTVTDTVSPIVLNVTNNLNISDGFLNTQAATVNITGDTTISDGAKLTVTDAAGILNFTGDVTNNTGGLFVETAAAAVNFAGNLENNGTFTASTGTHTFSGTGTTISGTTATSIPKFNITGTIINNNTVGLTVGTGLTGAGTLTQGAGSTLNIGGTSTVTGLDASTNANTVNYTGASQTVKAVNYSTLNFTGSGTKTIASGIDIGVALNITDVVADLTGTTTVADLKFAGVSQTAGTWGATGSGADNINDTYFSGTGTLDVGGVAVPTVISSVATAINKYGATLNGNISNANYSNSTVEGFEYGTDTSYGTTTTDNGTFSTGIFSTGLVDLTCGTTYHFRPYATNNIGTGYGSDVLFTTPSCIGGSGSSGSSSVSTAPTPAPVIPTDKFVKITLEKNSGGVISLPLQVDCLPGELNCPQALISSLKTPKLILGDPMRTTLPIFTCYDHPEDCMSASFKISFDQSLSETGKKIITDALNSSSKLGPWDKDNGKLGPWGSDNKTLNISVSSPESFSKLFPTQIIAKVSDSSGKVIDSFVLIGSGSVSAPSLLLCPDPTDTSNQNCAGVLITCFESDTSSFAYKLIKDDTAGAGNSYKLIKDDTAGAGNSYKLIKDDTAGAGNYSSNKLICFENNTTSLTYKLIKDDTAGAGNSYKLIKDDTAGASSFAYKLIKDDTAGAGNSYKLIKEGTFSKNNTTDIYKIGSDGSVIATFQKILNMVVNLNSKLALDGIFGRLTEDAVKSFQKSYSEIKIDGIIGPITLKKMNDILIGTGYSDPVWTKLTTPLKTITTGSSDDGEAPKPIVSYDPAGNPTDGNTPAPIYIKTGDKDDENSSAVSNLQNNLIKLGYSLPVTGYFGTQTKAAVMDFQTKSRLYPIDGIVGKMTLDAMGKVCGSCNNL